MTGDSSSSSKTTEINFGVGQFKLHANKARFQRATLNKGQGADHKKVANSSRPNSGDSGSSNSYVNAVKNHKSVDHDSPAIVLDEDCALSKDLSSSLMGRIKEFASLTNLKNALMNEGFVDLNVSYLGELWVLLEFSSVKSKEAFRDNVGVSSWFSEIRQASFDINPDGRIVWVEIEENYQDHFRGKVYWIRAKEVPGWTPDLVEDSDEEELSDDDSLEEGMKNLESENDCSKQLVVSRYGFFENEGTEVEAGKRMEVLAALRNIDHIHSMDLAQKAKIKWDETRRSFIPLPLYPRDGGAFIYLFKESKRGMFKEVIQASASFRMSVLKVDPLATILGQRVGGSMTRAQAWQETGSIPVFTCLLSKFLQRLLSYLKSLLEVISFMPMYTRLNPQRMLLFSPKIVRHEFGLLHPSRFLEGGIDAKSIRQLVELVSSVTSGAISTDGIGI
ncbi:hypothetical protein Tco_0575272 [Tanacetum coccineum]